MALQTGGQRRFLRHNLSVCRGIDWNLLSYRDDYIWCRIAPDDVQWLWVDHDRRFFCLHSSGNSKLHLCGRLSRHSSLYLQSQLGNTHCNCGFLFETTHELLATYWDCFGDSWRSDPLLVRSNLWTLLGKRKEVEKTEDSKWQLIRGARRKLDRNYKLNKRFEALKDE